MVLMFYFYFVFNLNFLNGESFMNIKLLFSKPFGSCSQSSSNKKTTITNIFINNNNII